MNRKQQVVFGLLGTVLDATPRTNRWVKWRPTISIFQHEGFLVDRFEFFYSQRFLRLAEGMVRDIGDVSPETRVQSHELNFNDPWDFEEVYGKLHDVMRGYPFDPEREDYFIHITTGTHVAQICMFLLAESHYFPGKLLQTSPPRDQKSGEPGKYAVIDLDLSKYDRLASRFRQEMHDDVSFLKSGIQTRNPAFNRLIEQIERVAVHSDAPMLLTGATGAGKSKLARRIYELKKQRRKVTGAFVEVNCATLRGDGAMSALFGHVAGAFTGAIKSRPGLLRAADGGMLFLDEVGELGTDEQAMLLRALEEKRFLPVGSDQEVESDFQLICGTNRDLKDQVRQKLFREDLLARINLWTFCLPGLRDRPEDIEPNVDYELEQLAGATGLRITFNTESRRRFLDFAISREARWTGNFRDLNGAIVRMATFAPGGRITVPVVEEEIARLTAAWTQTESSRCENTLADLPASGLFNQLDRFEQVQLAEVIRVCQQAKNLSEAGRLLFNVSRLQRSNINDADRLKKYLARYQLTWQELQQTWKE